MKSIYILYTAFGMLTCLFIYLMYKFISITNKIKKYRTEVKSKNEAWLNEHGLNDTTNKSIMHHLFGLAETNTYVIRKIESSPKHDELSVTIFIRGEELTLDLDINSVNLKASESLTTPNIEFAFNPGFLNQKYGMMWDTWEKEVESIYVEYFLYQAYTTLYLDKDLKEKIFAPIYISE